MNEVGRRLSFRELSAKFAEYDEGSAEVQASSRAEFEAYYQAVPLTKRWTAQTPPISTQDPYALAGRAADDALCKQVPSLSCVRSLRHVSELGALVRALEGGLLDRLEVVHVRSGDVGSRWGGFWEAVSRHARLWGVSVASSPLGDRAFYRALRGGDVRWLDLTRSGVGRNEPIAMVPMHSGGLRTLLLSQNPCVDRILPQLVRSASFAQLEALSFDRCGLGQEHLARAQSPIWSDTLRALSLDTNPIGDEGLYTLIQGTFVRNLHSLNVAHCNLSGIGLLRALSSNALGSLRSLNLSGNPLGGGLTWRLSGLGEVHKHREHTTQSLESVVVHRAALQDRDFVGLMCALSAHRVRGLHARANAITSEGICEGVRVGALQSLERLGVAGNRISDAGFIALLTRSTRTTLRHLSLSGNPVTDRAFAQWRATRQPCVLETLEISSTDLTTRGLRDLLYCVDIGLCPNLTSLRIAHTQAAQSLNPDLLGAFQSSGVGVLTV